jgi:hypothetical protein
MQQLVKLLEERNKCLQSFRALNETEIERMSEGDFGHIDDFYTSREGLLNLISYIEVSLERRLASIPGDARPTDEMRIEIEAHLGLRTELVNLILNQDLKIISMIESQKSTIIRELQSLSKNKKAIGSYKSGERKLQLEEEY